MSFTFNPFTGNFDNVPSIKDAKSVYTSVSETSANWNSVYTSYNENSATYATIEFANNKFLPLSGGTITGDLVVLSSLEVGVFETTTLFVETEKVGILTETPNVELTVNGKISSNSVIYDELGNSNNWNSVYSTVCAKSGIEWDNSIVQNYVTNSFLPLSGGTMTGKLIVDANEFTSKLNIGNAISLPEPSFLVNGDIWLTSGNRIGWRSGGVTYASAITNLSNTFNQPQIINLTSNVSPALRITQNGSANAFVVEDSTNPDATSFVIDNVGSVGIGLSSLSGVDTKLTVVGNVSSTGIIYAYGGNSDLWNSVYGLVNTISSNWDSAYNTLYNLSASLEESDEILLTVKNYLSTNNVLVCSLDVMSNLNVSDLLQVGDSNLTSTLYVDETEKVGILTENPNVEFTVNGQISSNSIIYDELGNSNNWNNVYTTFKNVSSTFLTTESDAQTLSFDESTSNLSISNGNIVSLSSLKDSSSVDTQIRSLTGNWQSTYTTVQTVSSTWNLATSAVQNGGNVSTIRALNQTEYNALTPDPNTLYIITS